MLFRRSAPVNPSMPRLVSIWQVSRPRTGSRKFASLAKTSPQVDETDGALGRFLFKILFPAGPAVFGPVPPAGSPSACGNRGVPEARFPIPGYPARRGTERFPPLKQSVCRICAGTVSTPGRGVSTGFSHCISRAVKKHGEVRCGASWKRGEEVYLESGHSSWPRSSRMRMNSRFAGEGDFDGAPASLAGDVHRSSELFGEDAGNFRSLEGRTAF